MFIHERLLSINLCISGESVFFYSPNHFPEMRIIAIIAILIIIPASPLWHYQNSTYASGSAAKQEGITLSYSQMAPGSYPSNNSTVNYLEHGNSSFLSYGIISTPNGSALGVHTDSYYNRSHLSIDINRSSVDTLSLLFSWNSKESASLTCDNLSVHMGGRFVDGLSFGPAVGFRTEITSPGGGEYIGSQPGSGLYWANITFEDSWGEALIMLSRLGDSNWHYWHAVSFSEGPGNLSIDVGEGYSNLTIYGIYVDRHVSDEPPATMLTGMGVEEYVIPSGYLPDANASFPFFSAPLNTVVYLSSDGMLVAYNTVNRSFWAVARIADLSSRPVIFNSVNGTNVTYFVSGNSSTSATVLSLSSLTVRSYAIDMGRLNLGWSNRNASDFALLSRHGNGLYYSASGNYTARLAGKIARSNVSVIGSSFLGDILKLSILNVTNQTVLGERFNFANGHVSVCHVSQLGMLSRGIAPAGMANTGSHEAFFKGRGMHDVSTFGQNGSVLVLPGSRNGSVISLDSTAPVFMNDGKIEYDWGGNTVLGTFETSPGNPLSGFFDRAAASGVMLTENQLDFFQNGTLFPVCNGSITASYGGPEIFSGVGKAMFNISTAFPFHLVFTIGNLTLHSNLSYVMLNASMFKDGSYPFAARFNNSLGYASIVTGTVFMDHYAPSFTLSPEPGAWISNDTLVSFSIADHYGIRSLKIQYLSNSISSDLQTGDFRIYVPGFSGVLAIYANVIDRIGQVFNYTFRYRVISVDLGGFMADIHDGEALNSTVFNLTWTLVQYVVHYSVLVGSNLTRELIDTDVTYKNLLLPNGKISLAIGALLPDGQNVELGNYTVWVISYPPELTVKVTNDSAFSFHGDSPNDTLAITVRSNVTCVILLEILFPGGGLMFSLEANNTMVVSLNESDGFGQNGIYIISISATSPSGTTSLFRKEINVNNTIPALPLPATPVYTNTSFMILAPQAQEGNNYTWTLKKNGTSLETGSALPGRLNFTQEGEYILIMNITDSAGNHNEVAIPVYFYNTTPQVSFSHLSSTIIWTNSVLINYTISDPAGPGTIAVLDGTLTLFSDLASSEGSILLHFPRNGVYNLTINVEDLCGNRVSVGLGTTHVEYFAEVSGAAISSIWTPAGDYFTVNLRGMITPNVRVTWFENGLFAGYGNHLWVGSPAGVVNVTAMVSFDGNHISSSGQFLSTGWIPLAFGVFSASALVAYRAMGRQNDPEIIRRLLLGADGSSLKELAFLMRKNRVVKRSMKRGIDALKRDKLAVVGSDPDGVEYLILLKNGNEKP